MELIHGLHKETLIEINGSLQKLGDIKVGDVVKGYDIEAGVVRDNKVVWVKSHTIDAHLELTLSNRTTIKVSLDSKVFDELGRWSSPINIHNTVNLHNGIQITRLEYIK